MVRTSKGIRKRIRNILSRKPRERGLSPLTRTLTSYEKGDMANIVLDPSLHGGMPHTRFHGKTGRVVGTQGRAYVLELRIGKKTKRVIAWREHLRKVEE